MFASGHHLLLPSHSKYYHKRSTSPILLLRRPYNNILSDIHSVSVCLVQHSPYYNSPPPTTIQPHTKQNPRNSFLFLSLCIFFMYIHTPHAALYPPLSRPILSITKLCTGDCDALPCLVLARPALIQMSPPQQFNIIKNK